VTAISFFISSLYRSTCDGAARDRSKRERRAPWAGRARARSPWFARARARAHLTQRLVEGVELGLVLEERLLLLVLRRRERGVRGLRLLGLDLLLPPELHEAVRL
jgi:hypothetical protein